MIEILKSKTMVGFALLMLSLTFFSVNIESVEIMSENNNQLAMVSE